LLNCPPVREGRAPLERRKNKKSDNAIGALPDHPRTEGRQVTE
jgi:hypothetical protein